MTDQDDAQNELRQYLEQRGEHTPDEIAKILARLAQYDADVMRQSVFDSIDGGGFDLDTIIQDALGDEESPSDESQPDESPSDES
ncbi:MAG: hypothetical protein QGG36_01665 [Pirellulaceae bacterium]|jgi:hypothetical protein|nr:hypothetical protein [Pirellulaceae bacterium]MDP7014485.1 hypothetical protein [Pirellulaceae bacterium]